MKKSPFKFLDAYTIQDREVFFGRETETEQLYQMMFKAPLALLYGYSGTGKTSLVQCGLAGRFDGADWHPFFIRRGADLNTSLQAALEPALNGHPYRSMSEGCGLFVPAQIAAGLSYFRPVRGAFILGSPEERDTFSSGLRALLDSGASCRVLLVIREEYLGQLYEMEQTIPELLNFRLRVEPMSNLRIREVIRKSCTKFNVTLEAPADDRCKEMIFNIGSDKTGMQLPYLQVYLDMLYRDDFLRTYGDKAPLLSVHPPLEFTRREIAELGEMEDILARFLEEQETEIARILQIRHGGKASGEAFVRRILDFFATDEGTKRPLAVKRLEGILTIEGAVTGDWEDLSPELVSDCLGLLEEARILRVSGTSLELAHDTLARLIDQQRSDEQRQATEVKNRVAAAFREWERSKEYLSRQQLLSMESDLPKVRLPDQLRWFVNKSEHEATRREQARQLSQNKRLNFAAIAVVILFISTSFALHFTFESKRANRQIQEANDAMATRLVKFAWPYIYELKYDSAYQLLSEVKKPIESARNVASVLYEVAYFYNESGQVEKANACVGTMLKIYGFGKSNAGLYERNKQLLSAAQLRNYLQKIDSSNFALLEKKYFPELKPVKGGYCRIGFLEAEKNGSGNPVFVPDFQMAETETTIWQYALFASTTEVCLDTITTYLGLRGDNPVSNISWYEAIQYANWVSKRYGLDTAYCFKPFQQTGKWIIWQNTDAKTCYRLPSEAEWEYAAKGGPHQKAFKYAGNDSAMLVAWHEGNSKMSNVTRTHPGRQLQANSLGLYDMSGNVWEWCQDWYSDKGPAGAADPNGPRNGIRRVVRGGSFEDPAAHAAVLWRGKEFPDKKNYDFGLRLVLQTPGAAPGK